MSEINNEDSIVRNLANNYVRPLNLEKSREYICAIDQIFFSMSCFIDERSRLTDSFLKEAITLLENSVILFEKGFFDAAIYSLRQSVEIASIFVYFNELPEHERKEKFSIWKSHDKNFLDEGAILNELKIKGETYKEIKESAPFFFEQLYDFRKKINKYVHKQGYKTFYTYLCSHPNEMIGIIETFEFFLTRAISIVAVFRVILDPLPILLLDDEIRYRLPNIFTEPFSCEFIKRYIGGDFLDAYKSTTLYKEFEEDILQRPKFSEVMYALKSNYYISRDNIMELECNIDDLTIQEKIILKLVKQLSKITSIYLLDGLIHYFTDKPGIMMDSYSSSDFKALSMGNERKNLPFKDGYLSLVYGESDFSSKDCYFIETLDPFLEEEFSLLENIVQKKDFKEWDLEH